MALNTRCAALRPDTRLGADKMCRHREVQSSAAQRLSINKHAYASVQQSASYQHITAQRQPTRTNMASGGYADHRSPFASGYGQQQQAQMPSYGQGSLQAPQQQQQQEYDQKLRRSSSFRSNLRSRTSAGSPGGGYSVYDTATGVGSGSGGVAATPKSVRWEDAPQFPSQASSSTQPAQQQQQQQQTPQQPFHFATSSSIYPSLQQPQPQQQTSYYSQQPQSSRYQVGGMSSNQSMQQGSFGFGGQSTSGINPYQLTSTVNTNMQTPQRAPQQAFGAAGFGMTNTTQTPQQQTQHSQALVQSHSSPSQVLQTKSAFSTSISSLTRPIAMSTVPARATAATSALVSKVGGGPSSASSAASNALSVVRDTVITPRSAVMARVKWNLIALLLNWLVPRFGPVNASYWLLLTATFNVFGGDSDVHLASVLSWLRSAVFILTFANMVEATVRLQMHDAAASQPVQQHPAPGVAALPAKRKPSLAYPPSRVPSGGAPSNTASSNSAMSASSRSVPRQYAQSSPLRESMFRASASAQRDFDDLGASVGDASTSSPLRYSTTKRMPSQSPRFDSLHNSSSSRSASPAAVFLARRHERLASSSGLGEQSFDGDTTADLSTEVIEVGRALRALSANYEREMSQGRSSSPVSVTRQGVVA